MTKYWRDEHGRTMASGTRTRVTGHTVNRDDWPGGFIERHEKAFKTWKVNRSSASRYLTPNAKCPVCGKLVFYYQNDHGSKVFFDDLGPPWPKHPCTDDESHSGNSATATNCEVVEPQVRGSREVTAISIAIKDAGYLVMQRKESGPISTVRLIGHYKIPRAHLIVLENCVKTRASSIWFGHCTALPLSIKVGSVLWANRRARSLMFLDLKSLQPKSLSYTAIQGAKAFVDALVRHNTT
jgi:hypothetical protein